MENLRIQAWFVLLQMTGSLNWVTTKLTPSEHKKIPGSVNRAHRPDTPSKFQITPTRS